MEDAREPDADAYLMVQDDVLFFCHPGLRSYLEQVLWPGQAPGVVSLFCPRDYTQARAGWHQFPQQWFWGAQTFIYSREAAQQFLADARVVMHRWNGDYDGGTTGIDVVIGEWAYRRGIPLHFPSPSLVQHVGEVSTLWETARIAGPRRADRFAGDLDL